MILGIGTDLTDIRRIAALLERRGMRFVDRIFTANERDLAFSRPDPAATLAKRFAAREACAKALGSGFRQGVGWKEIAVTHDAFSRPALALRGGAARRLAAITPEGMTARLHLSLSDEYPYAQAFVVIEAG